MTSASTDARISRLRVADMSPEQLDLYRSITEGSRATGPRLFALVDGDGGLLGPFEAMLRSAPLGTALQSVGEAVRYRTKLTARVREVAILAVAQAWRSTFESYAHEAVGRQAGLTELEIELLRAGSMPAGTDPVERAAFAATAGLVTRGDLTDAEYVSVKEHLGEEGIFELTTLVGYYATLALQMRVFRVEAPLDDAE